MKPQAILHAYKPDPEIRKLHRLICECPKCKGTLLKSRMCPMCKELDGVIDRMLKKKDKNKKGR